nr:gephyrin-like molybdotransferase Glp [Qaidamihabitans albus]
MIPTEETERPRTVDEHRAEVIRLLGTRPAVELPLADCASLVLADDVRAGVSLPPFDNSAMDGYAVRSVDVVEASGEVPVELPVAEDIPAGRTDIPALLPGSAHRIMTGAPMPPGADSVVMVEHTDGGTDKVRVFRAAAPGAHIRRTGEDVAAGTIALGAGTVLGPAQLGLASAVGLDRLAVHAPPRVLVVSTGTELVLPPQELRHGQIYESNSVMLVAALRGMGCHVESVRSVADDVPAFRAAIEPKLPETDLVVTSGGVSAGAYEVVKDALTGAGVRFAKVAMQPGGPQGCGTWDGVPVVTLPGNPVSVLVSFEAFLRPAVLAALGHTHLDRRHVRAQLTETLASPRGKRQFRRGYYTSSEGQVTGVVGPRGGPGSHLLAAFTQANCLIVLPEDVTEAAAGSEVDVLLI